MLRAYNLKSNKDHQLYKEFYLLVFLPLTLIIITILRSKQPLLYSLLAFPFSNSRFLVIFAYYKIRLTAVILIKFLTILLIAQLKNTITIKMATAVIVIGETKPAGI